MTVGIIELGLYQNVFVSTFSLFPLPFLQRPCFYLVDLQVFLPLSNCVKKKKTTLACHGNLSKVVLVQRFLVLVRHASGLR